MVIWGQVKAPSIDLCISAYSPNPPNEMFQQPLIQLMQDVGCDRAVDVEVVKVFPENTLDRLNSCFSACLREFSSPFIDGIESFSNFLGIVRLVNTFPIAYLILWRRTDGTSTSLHQQDKDLFWIIPHIGHEK